VGGGSISIIIIEKCRVARLGSVDGMRTGNLLKMKQLIRSWDPEIQINVCTKYGKGYVFLLLDRPGSEANKTLTTRAVGVSLARSDLVLLSRLTLSLFTPICVTLHYDYSET
jgi:hypothetical protein